MKKWRIDYYIESKNLYTHKFVYAESSQEAIKKANVKNIEDLVIIED